MSKRIFTEQDDKVLEELYNSLSNKELVEVFNGQYSAKQIKHRGNALGLKKSKETRTRINRKSSGAWEEWENEIVRRHYPRGSIDKCKKYLPHRSRSAIRHKAQRLGVRLDYDVFCKNRANGPREHSEETKNKISERLSGKPKSENFKNLISERMSGENHPNWNDGSSFIEYPPEFNESLKRKIRSRDKHRCQICGKNKSNRELCVHHIDYDKNNCQPTNLISLCLACHNNHHNLSAEEQLTEQKYFMSAVGNPYTESNI